MTDGHPIILFDAECVLCSANAQFILHYDRACHFRLAAMQGEVGAALFRRHGIDPADPDTIIVVDGDHALRDSDAVIAIYAGLGWPWRVAAGQGSFPARCEIRSTGGWRGTATRSSASGRRAGFHIPGMRIACCESCAALTTKTAWRLGNVHLQLREIEILQ